MGRGIKPSEYTVKMAIQDMWRYGDVTAADDCIMKYHEDRNFVEVNVKASGGHVSFDVYYDDNGKITRVERHNY